MFARLFLTITLFGLLILPVSAATSGNWHSEPVRGFQSYWTINKKGARFTIWCPSRTKDALPLIGIDIKGKRPRPDTMIRVELDHRLIKFNVSDDGFIRPDCPACGDNLRYFWQLLRGSARFGVLFEDSRHAFFSTKGARDVIPPAVCQKEAGLAD